MRRTGPKRFVTRGKEHIQTGLAGAASHCGQLLPPQEVDKERTKASGIGFFRVVLLVTRCLVVHPRKSSCLHADRLPRGHAAVLRSSRSLAGAFPLGATQGLRVQLDPLPALWGGGALQRCHVGSTCCHAAIWTPAEGQQEDNGVTRRRQEEERRDNRDNRRTRFGDRLAAVAKLHKERRTRKGQQEDNARTQRFTGAAKCQKLCFLFSKREPQQQLLGEEQSLLM